MQNNQPAMKSKILLLFIAFVMVSCSGNARRTKVTITGNQFYINGELTYKGRFWKGNKIEGLLLNSRMVQGIFDDLNSETRDNFVYPHASIFDTYELIVLLLLTHDVSE